MDVRKLALGDEISNISDAEAVKDPTTPIKRNEEYHEKLRQK